MTDQALHILFAGGGTGGHLFPGIAVSETFIEKNPDNRILFVGSGKAFENKILSENGYDHKKITAAGMKGLGLLSKLTALFKIPKGIFESFVILNTFKPDIIIGLGGYSSGPLILTAWLTKIYRRHLFIALQEQNIFPGITNRLLCRFANRIYISFEKTKAFFPEEKTRLTGNPVRKEILAAASVENKTPNDTFTILIIGGSQGAHHINMTVIEALKHIKNAEKIRLIHQTGENDLDIVKEAYSTLQIKGDVRAFFNDMDNQYASADMLICRAGATTISELTVMGKAALFIPFPFAADDHQVLNAQTLVEKNAAEMILEKDLTPEILAQKINDYYDNMDTIQEMARNAKQMGKPDAAGTIVNDCYDIMGKKK